MTERSSFEGLDSWIEELKKHGPNNLSMCIAGNKKDLKDQWAVTEQELKEKAKKIDASYCLTSAQDGDGIEVNFLEILFPNYSYEVRKPS
jgi:GTPase SAR1 family protein